MAQDSRARIAILYPGDYEGRRNATAENNRFAELFRAFAAKGIHTEPAVYHDDFCAEVREQLMQLDGVLVWVNPIQDGHTGLFSIPCFVKWLPQGFLSAHIPISY